MTTTTQKRRHTETQTDGQTRRETTTEHNIRTQHHRSTTTQHNNTKTQPKNATAQHDNFVFGGRCAGLCSTTHGCRHLFSRACRFPRRESCHTPGKPASTHTSPNDAVFPTTLPSAPHAVNSSNPLDASPSAPHRHICSRTIRYTARKQRHCSCTLCNPHLRNTCNPAFSSCAIAPFVKASAPRLSSRHSTG